ncbi:MAG: hypothetical protein ABJ000_18550 [Saccharospirillum sp.]|uniref:hypothetical protein n=1 Tax=Saccharospirillum sp. TaxID=2033801 RepID=UPI003297F068
MAQRVTDIGEQFEFYRNRFNPYQQLIHTGNGLSSEHLKDVEALATKIKGRRGDLNRLAEPAVLWIRDNPELMPLEAQTYTR